MRELNECLRLSRDINEINERLVELRYKILSPKNQIISDAPKGGGGPNNAIEEYIIKSERLEKRKAAITARLDNCWAEALSVFKEREMPKTYISLMWYRFYKAHSWKKCISDMKGQYPDELWNENKIFRIYKTVNIKCKR